jgi:hypothetical protein
VPEGGRAGPRTTMATAPGADFIGYGCFESAERVAPRLNHEECAMRHCPYPDCTFSGTEGQVNKHRAVGHRGEQQQGSNLGYRPRSDLAHRARPDDLDSPKEQSCAVCRWRVMKLPDGRGSTWVHVARGA